MLESLYKAFITLFVIIDPFYVCPVFIALTQRETETHRHQTAFKGALIATIVLLFFAFIGEKLLDTLNISQGAFQIAGGILLLFAAIEMVLAKSTGLRTPTADEEQEASRKEDISVFPLAIPLIAGPGAMTSIVMLMRTAGPDYWLQGGIIVVMIIVLLITYFFMRFSHIIGKLLGVTGTNVMTRALGILLAALSIQYIIDGLSVSALFS